MFGHDNNDEVDKTELAVPQPIHDGVLSGTPPVAATAPAINPKPAPAKDASGLGGFLPASDEPVHRTAVASTVSNDELIDIKQEALHALTPLIDHLDQTPEEKFRTTMMMLQASDDQSLVRMAYTAAKSITNEKERAQALLDIVNEINYFTQQAQAA